MEESVNDLEFRLAAMGLDVTTLAPFEAMDVQEPCVFVAQETSGTAVSRTWASLVGPEPLERTVAWAPKGTTRDIVALERLRIRYVCTSGSRIDQLIHLIGLIDADAILSAGERLRSAQETAQAMFEATASALDVFPSATAFDADFYTTLSADFEARIRTTPLSLLIEAISSTQETTIQHCALVTTTAVAFGNRLGLSQVDISRLFLAAFFHDVGKSVVPKAVIDKPGRLTDDEMRIMRTHVTVGHHLLRRFPETEGETADVALLHHEALDGSGYPNGLRGTEIPDLVRIVTISDIFAALIERRAYKAPMPADKAYVILRDMDGKLDQDLVRAFEPIAEAFPYNVVRRSRPSGIERPE